MPEKTYYGLVMLREVPRVQGYPNSLSLCAALRKLFVYLFEVIIVDDLLIKNLELLLLESNDYRVLISPVCLLQAVPETFQLWAIEIFQVVHFLSDLSELGNDKTLGA